MCFMPPHRSTAWFWRGVFCVFLLSSVERTPARAEVPQPALLFEDRTVEALGARIFPALFTMNADPVWRQALLADPGLKSLAETSRARLAASVGCATLPRCAVDVWKIGPDERERIGAVIGRIAASRHQSPEAAKARWGRDADSINYILAVYGEGDPPHYPLIDSASLDPASPDLHRLIGGLQVSAQAHRTESMGEPVFMAPLRYALGLLDYNDRDDAIRFASLWDRENRPPLEESRQTDWKQYRYAAFLVPGQGPEDRETSLSAVSRFRLKLAVELFREKMAPFILVSGGAVHPIRTRHVEAEEMRQELLTRYGIPPEHVVMEPYARHTTTNIRNAARVLARLGAPKTMETLIVTDPDQSAYIAGREFAERNRRELGYEPAVPGRRLSPFAQAVRFSDRCGDIDPRDPLDP